MAQKIMGTVVIILTCVWALTGCHTVQGAGEDIKSGGRALERATGD
ncbi:entericidin superfamily protein [Geotalea daltonii FRC-32]|uniref:Entericidin superfamily protein n=1 Tax=Geotalea daltonii (strain DSM 22248 / JCM 15807 / FRC-32) TaxID=316067 RepID=B9M1M6_GEODF|nr:entericidin A/B family lipoprotein [Geotalea daltonii]ACM21108.1 entericidin superfamily protein [Geotalea daltonii FRC-32]